MIYAVAAALAFHCFGLLVHAQTQTFLSRPGQTTVSLDVVINKNISALAPGCIFVTPHTNFFANPTPAGMLGPTIFDSDGDLVWAGNYTAISRVSCLEVCDFNGTLGSHLCYNDGHFIHAGGHSSGLNRVFDNTYTEVDRIGGGNGLIGPDMHEFSIPVGRNGRNLLQTVYTTVPYDLRPYAGIENGFVISGCFQDIELPSQEVRFQWCSLDHVPLEDTYVYLPASGNFSKGAGAGTANSPWDYFHINSIDMDDAGDYYVSGKKCSVTYKVAGLNSTFGEPGSIVWTLGGKRDEFTYNGFNYSWQHHVRVHSVHDDITIMSLFDNHWTGDTPRKPVYVSNGKIISINTTSKVVSLLQQYDQPEGLMAGVQGSTQLLPNGNVFMGWGPLQSISEHAPGLPGEVLFYAIMGKGYHLESYRNYKFPWKGFPTDPPDVFAYARSCADDLVLYMSWNGATEYRSWRVFMTDDEQSAGWELGTSIWGRTGYETVADVGQGTHQGRLGGWVYVQALDELGEVMGTSNRVRVFVPGMEAAKLFSCSTTRCPEGFDYDAQWSVAALC